MAVAVLFGEQESTEQVNLRHFERCAATSGVHPTPDVSLRRSEPPLR
jgi:hypothetical protein